MLMTNAPIAYSWLSPSQVIASSADGNKLIMCIPANLNAPYEFTGVFVSTNCGDTWSLTPLSQTNGSGWVASSADGKTLMASGTGFGYYGLPTLLFDQFRHVMDYQHERENRARVTCSADRRSNGRRWRRDFIDPNPFSRL